MDTITGPDYAGVTELHPTPQPPAQRLGQLYTAMITAEHDLGTTIDADNAYDDAVADFAECARSAGLSLTNALTLARPTRPRR